MRVVTEFCERCGYIQEFVNGRCTGCLDRVNSGKVLKIRRVRKYEDGEDKRK